MSNDKKQYINIKWGGVAVCRCPNMPLHSIMKPEDEAMLVVLLLSLQTEEDRQRFTQFYQQYERLMFKTEYSADIEPVVPM